MENKALEQRVLDVLATSQIRVTVDQLVTYLDKGRRDRRKAGVTREEVVTALRALRKSRKITVYGGYSYKEISLKD